MAPSCITVMECPSRSVQIMRLALSASLCLFWHLTDLSGQEDGLSQQDPAPPRFCSKQAGTPQPTVTIHPRGKVFSKAHALAADAVTSDWPRFLGPAGDGVTPETRILTHLTPPPGANHPLPLWTIDKGEGYCAPSIKNNHLVLHHRIGSNEVLECLDAETGGLHWSYKYPTTYRDRFNYLNGPRASPAMDQDCVYTCGVQGMLHCFDLQTGHLYWQRNLAAEFGLDEDFFGFTTSPLIEGNILILNLGGKRGVCVAAFDKSNGVLKWIAHDQWGRSYATPIVATMHDKRVLFVFAGGMSDPPAGGLLALDPPSGNIHFRFPWRSQRYFSANASSPVISGNRVFISSSYDIHGAMIEIQPGMTHNVTYTTRSYSSHWMTPILKDGYLYGFENNMLVCMDWETGRQMWKERLKLVGKEKNAEPENDSLQPSKRSGADQYREPPGKMGFGFGSLIWANGHFICLGETGLLAWLELSPKGCRIISSARLFSASQTWTAPVLSRGLLYVCQNLPGVETPPRLLCYDLRAGQETPSGP